MDRNNQSPIIRGRPVSTVDAAKANEFFEHFINAGTLKSILGTYRTICDLLHLKPNVLPLFYPKLKANLTSWRAKALWKKFDQRANAKCYGRGKICPNTRVLIIGAGPCGLRTAIEAQLLGAKVVVVEKRDRMSRNNVLHLWRFVIEDLRALGAKKFFGKFCAGAIDHISIRQVQCILLKVALLLGVEIHTEVSFEHLIEPNQEEKVAWRGQFKPADHPVSQFEFDVIIGADGKRNTLQGFQRKEFRGKLAIAITANFINKRTEAEARVEEISGVAFIFNQKFFKDLYAETGIDLENIVYYKDDTHYFVMTAKKASLINKRVIRQDLPDTAKLLAPENVDRDALMNYAREAAEFSTHYQMPNLEFAVNHYGQPDVAMFDFTSMYQAENASKIIERQGHKLLAILVGDSLLEPFWPTGSGCARGFLSSFDAAWAIRAWGLNQFSPLEIIAERESIYRLLAQTTPENLNKDYKAYTLDPSTRYPNLNKNLLLAHQMISFYDTDDRTTIELQPRAANVPDVPRKRRKRDSFVDPDTLLNWVRKQVREFHDVEIEDITSFRDGKILCAIIHHYRPDLIDYNAVQANDAAKNNQLAFDILEKEIGIPPVMTGEEMAGKSDLDFLALVSYLTQIYDTFRREIPHIKHPKMELTDIKRVEPTYKIIRHDFSQIAEQHKQAIRPHAYVRTPRRHVEPFNNYKNQVSSTERKSRKRRTSDKIGLSIEERQKRLEEIACNRTERQNKRRQQRKLQTEQFIKSMQMLQANALEPTGPFEDYSIFLYRQTAPNFEDRVKNLEKQFTYIPDRENARPSLTRGQTDEDFAARIKCIEDKYLEQAPTEKKPKDLLRAIGKIETTDWNIKEIEKKIQENKMGKPINKEKEKVPKWNREQFSARLTKMEKQHLERQDSTGGKFSEIDSKIKQLDQKLKEGTTRDLNQQKVATITEKLTSKVAEPESKPIQRSNSKSAMVLSTKTSSEYCHFCSRRVYLVERLSTEGKFFHRGCFRCQYCHTALRLNSYTYDRDGRYGHRFFCQQHFGMPGELYPCKIERKESQKGQKDAPQKIQTPERVEFENLSTEHISSEHEESISQMDEDEWTDRNFGQSAAELGSSDEYTSSSGTESDSEDNYVEALEEPFTKEGTLRWKERLQKRYSKKDDEDESDLDEYSSSDHSGYYDNMSDDDETDTATEGEEDIIARELRKQEVRVQPPVVHTDTGTDSEVSSNESSSGSSSDVQNSATEISTDSEFALEETTPTREVVEPFDRYVTKTRPNYHRLPKKVQVKSTILQKSDVRNNKPEDERRPRDTQLKFAPLVMDATTVTRKQFATKATTGALPNNAFLRHEGYALNRTQSTGGIAAKVSLELKKKYLLGESAVPGSIQKSGSVSTLDSKFKSFHSNITDCQKLLKPAPDISPSMKIFCSKLDERTTSPLLPSPTLLTSHSPPTFFNAKAQLAGEISEKESTKKSNHDDDDKVNVFENETEGRPRSPLHETSIIVPEIHWPKHKSNKKTDSLEETSSTESSSSTSDQGRQSKSGSNIFANIPRVEVHDDTGIVLNDEEDEMPFDSLNADASCDGPLIEAPKSITSERKTLNQPKPVPTVEPCSILTEVHNHVHIQQSNSGNDKVLTKLSNDRSTPSPVNNDSYADQATAALTETELSDWARDDDAVSDDCDEFNRDKLQNECINVAKLRAIEDTTKLPGNIDNVITECVNSILNPTNFDNIEFMDNNGTGTSSEENDDNGNNGYVQLRNEDESILADNLNGAELTKGDFEADSTSVIVEATNTTAIDVLTRNRFEDARNENEEQKLNDPGERNLDNNGIGATEAGTTTEENTCSDSTVKNVTEKLLRDDKSSRKSHDIEERANEADDGNDSKIIRNEEYEEHCQRLASKVEFGNAKDSIDIRKSKRKSKSEQQQPQEQQQRAPDLIIREEKEQINLNKLYKREEIEKERDINQRLIQEMVMNKMRAQNKSLERKKRSKVLSTAAASGPYDLTKSATTDLSIELRNNYNGANNKNVPPDLLTIMSLQKSQTVSDFNGRVTTRPLGNVHASNCAENNVLRIANNSDSASLPNLSQREQFKVHHNAASTDKSDRPDDELALNGNNNNNKSKQHKNKKSKENIYIEDSIESLVLNTERRNSFLYSNDTLRKKRNNSFRRSKSGEDHHRANAERLSLKLERPERKSVPDFGQLKLPIHHVDSNNRASSSTNVSRTHHKSDSNLLTNVETVKSDKRNHKKDVEQRKSFTKFLSDIFTAKKKDGASNAVTNKGGIFSKISPKGKGKSKSCVNLVELQNDTNQPKEANRRNSLTCPTRNCETPPPVPPLPYDYTLRKLLKDESSGNESDYRTNDDTLRRGDELCSRRNSRSGRKSCRQAQLKRHRLAQEIQRKLEEIDVKTRELERRGVLVEKALRGESNGTGCSNDRDDTDMLKEWFDLMRDRTELRRYEKELSIRARELELEDRHARLQQQLRERLDNAELKTEDDVKYESSIIKEMMDIVAKRDSLISLLEEDRLRYSEEDKDFEEQMLAKGLKLTPLAKTQ